MSRRFVSIWFPHLLTDWHTRKQPQLRNHALVLKASVHNRMVITAANAPAQAQGIQKGMVLADARALYPSLYVLDDKPGLNEQLLARMAEWCIRFTPVASADPPSGLLLDASGCTHLWGGEEAYLQDIMRRFTQRGYVVRAAMADTIGCAWAMARYGDAPFIVALQRQHQAMAALPVSSLRLPDATVVLLHKLGLRKVNDLLRLQPSALRRRFGPELLRQLQRALGDDEETITPVYPAEPYQERLPCLEPIVTRTGIELALEKLLEALCKRLRKEGKGLRTAFFRAYRIDGGTSGITIRTNQPSHHEEHLFHLFSLKLSTIEPKEGIELFLLEATQVEDYAPVQEKLWQTRRGLQDPQVSELIDRIAGKVGADAIRRYLPAEHYWPERSYHKASFLTEEPATAWRLQRPRPMLLLQPPEQIEVTAPIPDYPPMLFRHKGVVHKVSKADGPERIEQEWWIQQGEHRDYYCVEDEEGHRYWIFREGHYNEIQKPKWYLHGYFA